MVPEEIVESWIESQSELIDEKAASNLIEQIKFALAERTEQCAKIVDYADPNDGSLMNVVLSNLVLKIRKLNESEIELSKIRGFEIEDHGEIRALNTENKS
jgi:hypothetical protein